MVASVVLVSSQGVEQVSMVHVHRWVINRKGIGQCACGESRQFETRVNLDSVAIASMHPRDWREWQGNYRAALKLSPVYFER